MRTHGLAWAAAVALLAAGTMVGTAEAGRRHRGCGASYSNGCGASYNSGCATDYAAAPAPQPETVTKTIMVPETYYETITVPVSVWKPVTKTKTITVHSRVPRTREVNRTVTEYVNVPQTRTETFYTMKPTWKEVSRDVTIMVPTNEEREGRRMVCKPVMVTETRRVCRDQGGYETRSYTNCCGCVKTCQVWVPNIVTEDVEVQVCRPQMETETFTYNVTVCKPQTETRTFKVCEMVREENTRDVQFVSVEAKQVEKTFTENYFENVAEEKEISYVENVQETSQREVQVAKTRMVPKEVTYTVYPNGNGCQTNYGGCR